MIVVILVVVVIVASVCVKLGEKMVCKIAHFRPKCIKKFSFVSAFLM